MEKNFDNFYDVKAIKNELKKVVPERFNTIDVSDVLQADISFFCSIRQDAAKTTNALLYALVLYKLYKVVSVYVRNDAQQTTEAKVGNLFNKIVNEFDYISALFETFNAVTYKRIEKAFYLCRIEDGEIVDLDNRPFLYVASNEQYMSYKSGLNIARCWNLIWDEFLDTKQLHSKIVQELFDNISTFLRDDPRAHVIALSNGINMYDAIFDDLCLLDHIQFLDWGDDVHILTDLGSHYFFKMLKLSEERKENLTQRAIRFFGISKAKFAQFTGVQPWSGYNYPHVNYDDEIESKDLVGLIYHRSRWLGVYVIQMKGDVKPLIEIAKFTMKDTYKITVPVYVLSPFKEYEHLFKDAPKFILKAYEENRFRVGTNSIGLLFDDFLQENRLMTIKEKDKR